MFVVYIDARLCIHHKVNDSKVERYKKNILNGDSFPPVEVVLKDGRYLVLDGAHRTKAHGDLGEPMLAMVYDWNDCPKRFLVGQRIPKKRP